MKLVIFREKGRWELKTAFPELKENSHGQTNLKGKGRWEVKLAITELMENNSQSYTNL